MKKHYGYIYKIVCKINSKIYIGQTIQSISERWRSHKWKANRPPAEHDMAITRAINKYGPENFEISTICTGNNQKELDEREKFCIRIFKSIENGYNLHEGGLSQKISEETKRKMSAAGKGKKKPLGFGDKIRKARMGTKQPESVKIKCSLAQKGEKSFWFGRKHTTETKRKIGEVHKGKIVTKEQKEKQRLSMFGRKASEETKKKMSISRKGKKKKGKTIKCLTNGLIYNSLVEASVSLNISINSLSKHLKGASKSAQGFYFQYL